MPPPKLPGAQRCSCAAKDCESVGLVTGAVDLSTAQVVPQPPDGWGIIEAIDGDGNTLILFVCSRACERALARRLTTPRLGDLDG